MNTYVTGSTIRRLREAKGLTQAELAGTLSVSAKTISKWETAKGLPDISLLEPLAASLGVSVLELMQGDPIINRNRAANLLRSKLYVCPLCGNVLHATGQAVVSCCGITLPALDIAEAEDADEHHQLTVERVEDELFVTLHHPMEKSHYISFQKAESRSCPPLDNDVKQILEFESLAYLGMQRITKLKLFRRWFIRKVINRFGIKVAKYSYSAR